MLKKIIILFFILFLAIFGGGYYYLSNVDFNEVKAKVSKVVEEKTGRKLTFGGEVELNLFSFSPGFYIKDVTFSNAKWSKNPNLASIKKFELQIDIMSIFAKTVKLKKIIIDEPVIYLEKNKQGQSNLAFEGKAQTEVKEPEKQEEKEIKTTDEKSQQLIDLPVNVDIGEFLIKNAKLKINDYKLGQSQELKLKKFTIVPEKYKNKINLDLNLSYNDKNITLKGQTSRLVDFFKNNPFNLDINIKTQGFSLNVTGMIKEPIENYDFDFKVMPLSRNLSETIAYWTGSESKLLIPLKGNIELRGSKEKNQYEVNIKSLKVGKSDLSGNLLADLSNKNIDIVSNLYSNSINLVFDKKEEKSKLENKSKSADKQATKMSTDKEKSRYLIKDEKIDLSFLKNIKLVSSYKINELIPAKNIKINDISINTTITNGVVKKQFKINDIGGGSFELVSKLNSSKKPYDMAINADGNNIYLSNLLGKLDGFRFSKGGKTTIEMNLKTRGTSPRKFASNLNGKMLLLIDKARLESKILSLLNSGITGNEPTDLTCAVFNINSKNGYLELDKSIAMETKKLNMLVDGSVDLRTEKLDLLIKPSVQEGLRTGVAQIIAGLTKISGNFNSPSVAIDTSGAAKKALSIGAALLTGGVSMLGEKVATTMIEDKNPCYTALENTKYYGMYKNASVQQERKTKKTTKKKPKKPEDIIKGIGGALLKSLGNKKNNDGGSSSKKASSPKDFLNNLGGFLGQ